VIYCLLQKGSSILKGSSIFKLSLFFDEEVCLQVKGRLEHSSELTYEEKHPLNLTKDHCAKLIVRDMHYHLKHAAVSSLLTNIRNNCWICGL